MDDLEKAILRDFIGENWAKFEKFCEPHGGEVANEIYAALGGDPE